VSAVLLSACSSGSVHATPTSTTVPGHPRTYRWHDVTQSENGEVSTVDGVADLQHHRYSLHFHSSVGTASGGNMVISDGRWFAEIAHGVWCADPGPAQETAHTNADLAHPSIDPIEWWSKLRDGESSPTIAVTRFMGISFDTRRPPMGVVHRNGETLNVTFGDGPAPRFSVLTFSDFERAPSVVVPTGTKPCPTQPPGD
jgi:hypothetical protein